MGDVQIPNVWVHIYSLLRKLKNKEKPTTNHYEKEDIGEKRELKEQVEKAKGVIYKAKDIIDSVSKNNFTDLKNLDKLLNELKCLIPEQSEKQLIEEISSVSDVVDLSVTGLTKGNLKSFWDTVKKFNNLTSLTVAMSVTEQSAFILPDCGDLERLRMEGKFPISSTSAQSYSGLNKLNEFTNLIDLTLASHEPINIDSIPASEKLLCLRLYGVCNETIFKIEAKQFKSLKKLVIGDMKNVETVQIGGAVIETLATLKLCKLPKLKELVSLTSSPNKKQTILKWGTKGCSRNKQSPKTIYLRDFDNIPNDKSPGLTIYNYDMNKQCYNEVIIKP